MLMLLTGNHNKSFGELYQKTKIKEDLLKTQFNVISKWV